MPYFDHAATTPVRREVLEAMAPHLATRFGNPSSHHAIGAHAAQALAEARERVARVLGFHASEVIFTSGGTEANNLAVKGVVLAAIAAREARHLLVSPIEHESILESADYLRRWHGVSVEMLPVSPQGLVDPIEVTRALRPDTALVSIGYANNEIGTVQDIAGVAEALARSSEHRVPLHTDAVQAAGWLPLDATEAALVTIAGHKIGAVPGIGALAVRSRVPIEPLVHGGGQESGRRSGTESVALAVGLATALECAEAERAEAAPRVAALRDAFVAEVARLVPFVRATGDTEHRLPGTASFALERVSGESVLLELERRGVLVSSGSACAAGHDDPSHVLLACGFTTDAARTGIRFTFSPTQTESLLPTARLFAEAVSVVAGLDAPPSGRNARG